MFRDVEIPHGVELVNVKGFRFEGGTFREKSMTEAEKRERRVGASEGQGVKPPRGGSSLMPCSVFWLIS